MNLFLEDRLSTIFCASRVRSSTSSGLIRESYSHPATATFDNDLHISLVTPDVVPSPHLVSSKNCLVRPPYLYQPIIYPAPIRRRQCPRPQHGPIRRHIPESNMHNLHLQRRFLKLLDRSPVLSPPQRLLPPCTTDAEYWIGEATRRHDGVLYGSL